MPKKSRKKKKKERKRRFSKQRKNDAASQGVGDSPTCDMDSCDSESCGEKEVSGCCRTAFSRYHVRAAPCENVVLGICEQRRPRLANIFGRRHEKSPARELTIDDEYNSIPPSKDGSPASKDTQTRYSCRGLKNTRTEGAEEKNTKNDSAGEREPTVELFEALNNLCKPKAKVNVEENFQPVYLVIDNYDSSVLVVLYAENAPTEPNQTICEPSMNEYVLQKDDGIFQIDIPEFEVSEEDTSKDLNHILIPLKEFKCSVYNNDVIVVDSVDFEEIFHELENTTSIKLLQNTKLADDDIFHIDIPEFEVFEEDIPKNLDHILIPFKEFKFGVYNNDVIVLDSVDFGEIFYELGNTTHVKLLQNTKLADVEREAKIQRYLRPANYVPILVGIFGKSTGTEFLLLQTFEDKDVTHQTLNDIMQACLDDKVFISKRDWINVCWFLAICLQDMHEFGVLHNNIRTDNILIEFRVKPVNIYFTDLGKATFRRGSMLPLNYDIEDNDYQKDHLAPEVCQYMPSSPESDIYSLGKVFEEINKHCNCLTALLYHMCREDPDDRLTIKEVMEIIYILMTETDL